MKKNYIMKRFVLSVFVILFVGSEYPFAAQTSQQVDWRIPGGGKIKQIRYLKEPAASPKQAAAFTTLEGAVLSANLINSPPVYGFIPWIVVITTNKRAAEEDWNWQADVEYALSGTLTVSNIQNNYAVGIFDTGASAHVFGYENAVLANLFNATYKTDNTITITGVTGSVDAWVSQPLGLFVKGLSALEQTSDTDPNAKLFNTTGFVGESNVSILLGDDPGEKPDLATVIGSPFSVYYITHIRNDTPITITRNGQQMTSPDIQLYPPDDLDAPSYLDYLPLELRPLGGVSVQYITMDLLDPSSPSVIIGNSSQSLFFVHSVDLTKGVHSAIDRSRFMFDTGAQVTVIGSRVAARLALNPANKDFEVKIEGVSGETIMAPGFFIDSLTMPTIGEWLEYTHVPVVMLDIASPEGGTLDGIIGMNLFNEYNLILRGGGLFLHDDPVLEFERISRSAGDIAPLPIGDGIIDMQDLNAYSQLWMTTTQSPGWNARADIAPPGSPDGVIDLQDLLQMAQNWLAGTV